MPLDKLRITNLDNGSFFEVLFNPTEYTVEDGSTWQDYKKPRYNPELQYIGGARKTLSMELFCDTYETGEDVRIHTGRVARLLVATSDQGKNGKRPPKVKLMWGPADPDAMVGIFPITWVLEKLTQKFTLFKETGLPVRATLNVTFKEFIIPKEEIARKPRDRSFPDKTYTTKTGDTVSGIASSLWKDPTRWRVIAESNEIDNPRLLQPGRTLLIPAIT